MRNITPILTFCLATAGAYAQEFNPNDASLILDCNQVNALKTSTRVALKNISGTNSGWFTGLKSETSLTTEGIFNLVPQSDNQGGFKINKAFPANAQMSYLSSNNATKNQPTAGNQITYGAEDDAVVFKGLLPKIGGTGNTELSNNNENWQNGNISMDKVVRFAVQPNSNVWINIQNPAGPSLYNSGKGGYTVQFVYNLTDYAKVTINEDKNGTKTTKTVFWKKGTEITVPQYEGWVTSYKPVTKDETDNQVIDVSYTYDIKDGENILLMQNKVGYPSDAALYEALKTAIDGLKASFTTESCNAYEAALTALYTSTTINLPKDGKTYVFTNHHLKNDGTVAKNYLSYNEQGLTLVGKANTTAENYPQAAKFTCHEVETGKYLFVNNEGKYLVVKGGIGNVDTNGNKGFVTTYDATFCPLFIQKDNADAAKTKQQFGLVSFGGHRADKPEETTYFIIKFGNNTYSFDQTHDPTFYNTVTHSTAFSIEEVAYANTPELKAIEGKAIQIQGAKSIATFSAPFATLVPEGVKAYYIAADGYTNGQTIAKLTAVDAGKAIPANQGVILTGTETGRVTMVPAAAEAVAELTGNQLGHTAGATKVVTENLYVLGKSGENVGFFKAKANTKLGMNKAYLMSTTQTAAIELQFGNEVTGIDAVESATNEADAPIYDLTGRRVNATVKGGIYIQNGKKFIVK